MRCDTYYPVKKKYLNNKLVGEPLCGLPLRLVIYSRESLRQIFCRRLLYFIYNLESKTEHYASPLSLQY